MAFRARKVFGLETHARFSNNDRSNSGFNFRFMCLSTLLNFEFTLLVVKGKILKTINSKTSKENTD